MTSLPERFREALPAGLDGCTLRYVDERTETVASARGVVQPIALERDRGAMVTVFAGAGLGYAATPDTSVSGLRAAIARARAVAEASAGRGLFDARRVPRAHPKGTWRSPVERPWASMSLADRVGLVEGVAAALRIDPRVVDWRASVTATSVESRLLTESGGDVTQLVEILSPDLAVVASEGAVTQRRSFGGRGASQQGGLEVLGRVGFLEAGPRFAAEAIELLSAPECPSGRMHLLLAPDQMMLQIHESIGHPLELDRILGDERNFAGTSFVTPEMFGSYRYGSELLDVTFDPGVAGELASAGFDDEGLPTERVHLIRAGILERPLGGAISQARAGMPGTANARASSWNRPPIDRMANLNLEPKDESFDALVARVERGVYMRTNASWSIDDARNKFQFGCEWGRLIEGGKLTRVVKNPNYRGVSASFWRSLVGVGERATMEVLGTPFCGKGEPNQVIRVGHASPVCLFEDTEVFGGDA